MQTGFCHLHLHTEYSMLDSLCTIDALLRDAGEAGMEELAITDHHSLSGAIYFYQKARECGIKPIIGVELNIGTIMSEEVSKTYHLIALAKNNLGYTNLLKLISRSNLTRDGLVSRSMLEELKHGLIILSGCCESELDELIGQDYQRAKEVALEYRNILGQNNYYLELQRAGLPGEEERIQGKLRLARDLNIPIVATNNVHYLKRESADTHQLLPAIKRLSFEESHPKKLREEYYLKSTKEMIALFADLPEAVENTVHIAERCNIYLDFEQRNFPRYPDLDEMTAESFLHHCCLKAIHHQYGVVPPKEVSKRLEAELTVINQMGYAGYFLIIWDLVCYAKRQGILVSGRGSAAGSLVCYLLGITALDPVEYGLTFERFLNVGKGVLPDIDLDIDHIGRTELIHYLAQKYGDDHVAHISVVSPLTSLALIRGVAKAQGWPDEQLGVLGRFVANENLHEVNALTNSPEFREVYETSLAFRKLIEAIQQLDGLPRHLTQHPTGLVLTQDLLNNYTPLQYARDGEVITQFDLHSIETIGLCKLDLLGVRFLTAIGYTIELLQETRGLHLDLAQIPVDDHPTYRTLQRGDTLGCFELEGETTRRLLKYAKPASITEIIFTMILSRLDEAEPELVQRFLNLLHEVDEVQYPHPLLHDILKDSYGIIIFQEQLIQIVEKLAGYTPEEADHFRLAILKKDRLKLANEKSKFVKRAEGRGLTVADANYLYDELYRHAKLCFCKAHVATYALLAYQSVYLKTHYPVEYFTGLLNAYIDVDYRFRRYINLLRYRHISVLSVDINKSNLLATVHVENQGIRLGLLQVKGICQRGQMKLLPEG